MTITCKKPMRTLEGAIGKKRCEVNLQKILEELGNRLFVNKIFGCLLDFREGLRQLSHIPERKWRYRFMLESKERTSERLTQLYKNYEMPEHLYTHAMCCMMAYFREAKENNK